MATNFIIKYSKVKIQRYYVRHVRYILSSRLYQTLERPGTSFQIENLFGLKITRYLFNYVWFLSQIWIICSRTITNRGRKVSDGLGKK